MAGSNSLGEAVLDLTADESPLMGKVDAAKNTVLKKMETFGRDMTTIGTTMTKAFTLPIVAAGALAIDAASNFEETKNKVRVIFGEMSEDVVMWSETSATALGQSQTQALAAAANYGNLFTTMGMGPQAAEDMSISLVELASDLASFNNANPEDVLAALQSGLIGQAEPMRKFGVLLTEDAVSAKAMEMGLADANGELSEAAKVQARYALILEQTKTAQGDFANTSDGLANSTRIVKAQLQDAAVMLGQQLLPYGLKAVQFVSDLVKQFTFLSPTTQKVIMIVLAVVAAIGPLLMVVGGLISGITAIIPIVTAVGTALAGAIPIILAVAAVVALLYLAWTNNWGGIRDKMAAVWAWLQPILKNLWDWLKTNIPLALQALADYWQNQLLPAIQTVWEWMNSSLFPFFQALGEFLGAVFGVALKALAGIWENVLAPALENVWDWLSVKLMPVFEALSNFWTTTLQPIVEAMAKWFGEKLAGAFSGLSTTIEKVTDWLNTMADILNNLTLPDWMTPGSPTPWEIGLLGVSDMLRKVGDIRLPALAASMQMMPVPAIAGGGMTFAGGGRGAVPVQFTYQPFISVNDEYEAVQKMRRIIDQANRGQANK